MISQSFLSGKPMTSGHLLPYQVSKLKGYLTDKQYNHTALPKFYYPTKTCLEVRNEKIVNKEGKKVLALRARPKRYKPIDVGTLSYEEQK